MCYGHVPQQPHQPFFFLFLIKMIQHHQQHFFLVLRKIIPGYIKVFESILKVDEYNNVSEILKPKVL